MDSNLGLQQPLYLNLSDDLKHWPPQPVSPIRVIATEKNYTKKFGTNIFSACKILVNSSFTTEEYEANTQAIFVLRESTKVSFIG